MEKNCIITVTGLKLVTKYFHSSIMCFLGKTSDVSSMTQSIPEFLKVSESP